MTLFPSVGGERTEFSQKFDGKDGHPRDLKKSSVILNIMVVFFSFLLSAALTSNTGSSVSKKSLYEKV